MCSDSGVPSSLSKISREWEIVSSSVKDCIINSAIGLLNKASKCRSPKYLRTKRQLKVEKAMKRMNRGKRFHKSTSAQGKLDDPVAKSSQMAVEHKRSQFDLTHFLQLLESNKALSDVATIRAGSPVVEAPLCQRIQDLRLSHPTGYHQLENAMIDFRRCVANELESRCPCADSLLAQRHDILSMIVDTVYTCMALVAYKHCRMNRAMQKTIMSIWDKYSYLNRLNTGLRAHGLRRKKKTKSCLVNPVCSQFEEPAMVNGLDESEVRIKLETYAEPTAEDIEPTAPSHFSYKSDSIEWLLEDPVQSHSRKRKCRTPNRHSLRGDPTLNGRRRHDVVTLAINPVENGECEALSDSCISASDHGSCGSPRVVGNALSESLNRLLVRARNANCTNNENFLEDHIEIPQFEVCLYKSCTSDQRLDDRPSDERFRRTYGPLWSREFKAREAALREWNERQTTTGTNIGSKTESGIAEVEYIKFI